MTYRDTSCLVAGLAAFLSFGALHSQELPAGEMWRPAQADSPNAAADAWIRPPVFRAFDLNSALLRERLIRAPREFTPAAQADPAEITLPMPDGALARFRVVESPVMAPELAAKFPDIRTYSGQGLDDPTATVHLSVTPSGLHAQVLSPRGAVYIDPHLRRDARRHVSYSKRDYRREADGFQCLTHDDRAPLPQAGFAPAAAASSVTLRTYRLAVAATGEYTQFHGGTVAAGLAAIVTAVNRVNGIYESELAIRFVLVANNDLLVFTNAATDPYTGGSITTTTLSENQVAIDSRIGDESYDLGHLFCATDGGLALFGNVCSIGEKALCGSGSDMPVGDPFFIDYVAHEIGHQLGAHHSFNAADAACSGSRTPAQAFEPGSGSTIMAYAGLCGADNVQSHSDPYFHFASRQAIEFYTTVGFGADCPVTTATSNAPPVVSVGAVTNYHIPKGTPFTLTASGSDPNGDPLTFCWEQRDLGPALGLSAPDNGSSPLFRSFPPTSSPSRTFPKLSDILSNTTTPGERLPMVSRTMKFSVTARDNRAGGGGASVAAMQLTVNGTAGPFTVTSPNTPVIWSGARTVTWNVAGTTAAPISAAGVDILLSTDGGLTFPIALATNTPNDGTEAVTLPDIPTTTARIKVLARGNVFFDISDSNFTIAPPIPPEVSLVATMPNASESGPQAGVFTVSRTGATTGNLTVFYSVGGTATSGADFTPLSGAVTISNGSATALVTMIPVDDALAEPGETVVVTLATNAAYTIHSVLGSATATIADNDVASLSISDASVVEGTGGTTNALFQVTLSLPSSQLVTVPYTTSNGTALAGMDYVAAGATLRFTPGQTTQTLGITISGDALFEMQETFFVNLGSPANATLARSQGLGTIVDDEIRVTLAARAGDDLRLEFNTLAGRSYRVERNDALGGTNGWTAVAGAASVAGNGGLVPVTHTNAFLQPRGFYRVRLLP